MMKDKIKFYDSKEIFVKKCPVCFKRDHASDQCTLINYLPDRDFIIKKINFSVMQERARNIKLVRWKKYNALKNRHLTLSKALKVEALAEENDSASGISSDENEFSLPEKYHKKEKRKRTTTYLTPSISKKEVFSFTNEEFIDHNENDKKNVPLQYFFKNNKIITLGNQQIDGSDIDANNKLYSKKQKHESL